MEAEHVANAEAEDKKSQEAAKAMEAQHIAEQQAKDKESQEGMYSSSYRFNLDSH